VLRQSYTIQYSGSKVQHKGEYYIPSTLTTVTVTDDIQLGYGDFYNCKNIKNINLKCLLKGFGKCCFEACTLTVNAPSCMDKSLANNYGGKKITWKYYNATSILDAVLAPIEDQEYSWPEVRPTVDVTLDDKALIAGTDYSVEYSKNTEVGTAQATVRGAGKYIGVLKTTFRINRRSLESAVVSGIMDQRYSGSPLPASLTATLDDVTLRENRDYTLERLITVDGNACVRITGTGNYKGVIQRPYRVFYGDVLRIPPALTEIGLEAFEGSGAEYIVLPDTCRVIGSRAFANCSHLFRIWIPASVQTIKDDAFPGRGKDLVIIAPAGSRAYEFAIAKGYSYESAVEVLP